MNEISLSGNYTHQLDVPSGRQHYNRYGKRGFDLALALLLLPVIVPAIAALWLVIRCTGSRGFFGHTRVGRDGRPFTCWKLKTMTENAQSDLAAICANDPALAAEWQINQKLTRDPRVTRLGGFLRATRLDEFPQIWNVLRGDMSFVGPRPFMTSQKAMYCTAGGAHYFLMRPGITGPWQLSDAGVSSFATRIGFDDDYCLNMSFAEDLKYVLKTAFVIFRPGGC